jgi:hypothetical protein
MFGVERTEDAMSEAKVHAISLSGIANCETEMRRWPSDVFGECCVSLDVRVHTAQGHTRIDNIGWFKSE